MQAISIMTLIQNFSCLLPFFRPFRLSAHATKTGKNRRKCYGTNKVCMSSSPQPAWSVFHSSETDIKWDGWFLRSLSPDHNSSSTRLFTFFIKEMNPTWPGEHTYFTFSTRKYGPKCFPKSPSSPVQSDQLNMLVNVDMTRQKSRVCINMLRKLTNNWTHTHLLLRQRVRSHCVYKSCPYDETRDL